MVVGVGRANGNLLALLELVPFSSKAYRSLVCRGRATRYAGYAPIAKPSNALGPHFCVIRLAAPRICMARAGELEAEQSSGDSARDPICRYLNVPDLLVD
jgi:hypothetical protein